MPWPRDEMSAFVSRPVGRENGAYPALIVEQQRDLRAGGAFAMTHREPARVNNTPFESPVAQKGIRRPGQLSQIAHDLTFGRVRVIRAMGQRNETQCLYIKRRGAIHISIRNADEAKGAGPGPPAKRASVQPNGLSGRERPERLVRLTPHRTRLRQPDHFMRRPFLRAQPSRKVADRRRELIFHYRFRTCMIDLAISRCSGDIMHDAIGDAYRRGFGLIAALPLLILIVVLVEAGQHVLEARLGMYAGSMDAQGMRVRLGYGAVKALVTFAALLVAWRWWRFAGDLRRAMRPTAMLGKGILLFVLIQLGGEALAVQIGQALAGLAPEAGKAARTALVLLPVLLWLFVSLALFPWYVGLATDDRAMTLRASIDATRGRLLATWGLLLAGIMPLMVAHYALGYAAMRPHAPVMALLAADSILVGALVAMIAATYFTIYARAAVHSVRPE